MRIAAHNVGPYEARDRYRLVIDAEDREESRVIEAWWRAVVERGMRAEFVEMVHGFGDDRGATITLELREGSLPGRDPLVFGASS